MSQPMAVDRAASYKADAAKNIETRLARISYGIVRIDAGLREFRFKKGIDEVTKVLPRSASGNVELYIFALSELQIRFGRSRLH